MKIIYFITMLSLLASCSSSKKLKEQQRNHFKSTETTYQETIGSTSLSGIVTEAESNEPVIFGAVALYQNGVLITGVETDFDGKYTFVNLAKGIYEMEVSYVGFPTKRVTNVEVKQDFNMTVNIALKEGVNLTIGCGIGYEIPLVEQDNTTSGQTLTSDQIKQRRSSN